MYTKHTPLLYNIGETHCVALVASDTCFPPALKDSIFNVLHVLITPALLKAYQVCFYISQAAT